MRDETPQTIRRKLEVRQNKQEIIKQKYTFQFETEVGLKKNLEGTPELKLQT